MQKIGFLALAAAVSLGGCAKDIYDKPGGTQEQFNADLGTCQMFAMGQPQYQPAQLPPNYAATTTYTPGGAYTTIQAQPDANQGMANLGAAIGNIAREKAAMHACMVSRGYTLRGN